MVDQTTAIPPTPSVNTETDGFSMQKIHYYWGKVAFVLLMLHAAYGFWESFKFLVFEYPELDNLLQAHAITAAEVTDIVTSGVILLIATLVAITMAWRLHSTREEVATKIDLALATIIIVATPFMRMYLETLPWLDWIQLLF